MEPTRPANFGPYSPVKKAGNYYFVSGQVGVDEQKHAEPDIESQTEKALQNLSDVLETEGLTMADVVKTTVFLKNIDDFAAMNAVYVERFLEPRPARSCVAVASLPKIADNELLVEVEAIAYKEAA